MSEKKEIHLICAARPNFMKVAPLYHALKKESWANPVLVHTGQHYDAAMSDVFFQDLELPEPDIHLGVGSGTHAEQTGKVMIAYEKVCLEKAPDLVVVVGDVNSTVACTLAATKLHIPTAHLEAGLRSFDRRMPEELNRLVTDQLVDLLWTPSPDGDENLLREGIAKEKIDLVGNIMIDSLEMLREKFEAEKAYEQHNLTPGSYAVVTLHRPSNVDSQEKLKRLVSLLHEIADRIPVVYPLHPRTKKNLEANGLLESLHQSEQLLVTEPLPYRTFMSFLSSCRVVVTDSGGIQEETTYLGIPCITLRDNTERPITVTQGTNQLAKFETAIAALERVLADEDSQHSIPELWDGKTAGRVVASIRRMLSA